MEKKYLTYFVFFTLIIIISTGLFNWFINPYSIYNSPSIDGVNVDKPEFINFLRLTKAYQAISYKPSTLILGTSRTGMGLDPNSSVWGEDKVYNLSLPGVHLYEMFRYFQHANASNQLNKVILGIDFRLFISNKVGSGFSELRMKIDENDNHNLLFFWGKLSDKVSTLFSVDSLITSLKTIRHQGWTKEALSKNGSWGRVSGEYEHRKAFNAYMRSTFTRLDGILEEGEFNFKGEEYLTALLQSAYKNNIQFYFIISPSHAWHWEAYRVKGLWDEFEDMKRLLVRVNEREALRAKKIPFPIWDFSGYNSITTEQVPPSKQKAVQMKWFWESVHYKKDLGDLMLNKIFLKHVNNEVLNNDFGVQLNSDNIEEHLYQQRIMQQKYMVTNNIDILHIMNLIEN